MNVSRLPYLHKSYARIAFNDSRSIAGQSLLLSKVSRFVRQIVSLLRVSDNHLTSLITGAIALVPRVSAKFGRFSPSGGSEFLPRLTCGS